MVFRKANGETLILKDTRIHFLSSCWTKLIHQSKKDVVISCLANRNDTHGPNAKSKGTSPKGFQSASARVPPVSGGQIDLLKQRYQVASSERNNRESSFSQLYCSGRIPEILFWNSKRHVLAWRKLRTPSHLGVSDFSGLWPDPNGAKIRRF